MRSARTVLVHLDVAAVLKISQIRELVDDVETREDAIIWAIHNVKIVRARARPRNDEERPGTQKGTREIILPPGNTNMALPKPGRPYLDKKDDPMVQIRSSELRRLRRLAQQVAKTKKAEEIGLYR